MLKNYLTTAYRHLRRHPLYSAINIIGFAVGLACCIVIIAYVRGELSYERFIPDNDRIYRVVGYFHGEPEERLPVIMGPAGPAMAAELPGIESFTRFRRDSDSVKRGDTLFYEIVLYADGSFFDTIPLPLIAGDPETAIRSPNTVVLSETMAKKYFGSEDPMGQVMVFDGDKPMTVTGVLKDLPENTHLKIDFLSNYRSASYSVPFADRSAIDDLERDWQSSNHFTYLRLKPEASVDALRDQLKAFAMRHVPDTDMPSGRMKGGDFAEFRLQAFADIHLRSSDIDSGAEIKPPGDIALVYGFSGIAALILLIASINFVVLTTARSAERAKEVGMRKVLGSSRRMLIVQFFVETLVIALVAFVVALSIAELATPMLRDFLEAPFAGSDPEFVVAELMVIAGVGLAAGAYPALYMSAMRPAEALKGRLKMARSRVRSALVVIQFTISIALIIIASIMFAQTDYMRHVRPGFNADDVVVVRGFWRDGAKGAIDAVRARIANDPSVLAIAAQHAAPGDLNFENRTFKRPGEGMQRQDIATTAVDYSFFDLYQVRQIAGRGFARDHAADVTTSPPPGGSSSANAIITLSAIKQLGFATPEAALGQPLDRINVENGADTGQVIHYTIIGVVDDFQIHDARFPQVPTVFFVKPDDFWSLSIKARPGQAGAAAEAAEAAWRAVLPNLPARVIHLDDQFADTFKRDARKGAVFAAFALLGLSIACVGLFGLAAFTVERRTKEIGIRKVMGASSGRIVGLLVWQFSRPVMIANLIAWPLAWYVARSWLEGFADRIDLTPTYFVAASVIVLMLAWLTVSGHAVRVARAQPIKALRYE